ncbi:SAICAR synthase-like protein [Aspergillus japonicus CBS 114.51]|uniref:SAICAR synthase-like protein n=2 Tax=Aspergillus TaxID=5052 RepID=A0A2V5HBZ9_ASPV1|nr:SAICAR synthase-like protein [Aspergillus japonicus CBS 114.51]PYI21899.1 SAICAR synthase-like protein [Aspergillus violaceofuscus CBS 115571]RAH83257.1 SAICAR synthase-like protein [Aspergillus japonicus CBS 114.51]
MGNSRHAALSKSIQRAIFRDPASFRKTVLGRFLAFFTILYIKLIRYGHVQFQKLRSEVWQIDEEEYKASFRNDSKKTVPLRPMGDLGLSGSTFFSTSNSRFLVKSLPRHFEHSFFREELLDPYYKYMTEHPQSLLVWITDYVYSPYWTIGNLVGTTPAHHIIMENLLCGRDTDPAGERWETYDLKPVDYFFPERDLVPDPLVSKATLSKIADNFNDKVRISQSAYVALMQTVEADTQFLEAANAVDYSLYLVRFPAASTPDIVGRPVPWRIGLESADGKWKYRAVILDFFWARHKLHAQAMTGVIQTFNVIGRQGPMTITTTPDEYRKKFLTMVKAMIEVQE